MTPNFILIILPNNIKKGSFLAELCKNVKQSNITALFGQAHFNTKSTDYRKTKRIRRHWVEMQLTQTEHSKIWSEISSLLD